MSDTIKRCPQCGTACIYTDAFCVVCGHQFEQVVQKREDSSAFVPLQQERGTAREATPPPMPEGRAPAHVRHSARSAKAGGKKRRRPTTRAFMLVVVAILIIAVYYGIFGENGLGLSFAKDEPAAEALPVAFGPLPPLIVPVEPVAEVPEGFTPVRTAGELLAMNDDLTGSYILMNDIHLGGGPGQEWVPIGAEEGKSYASLADYGGFAGFFDGNGYTVSGLYLALPELQQNQVAAMGLFAMVMDGTVRNLSVQGEVVLSGQRGTYTYAGGIAGVQMANGRETDIQNCTFTGRVGGATYNGGIVGMQISRQAEAAARITHCASAGAVSGKMAGGIVGCQVSALADAITSIRYCYNMGQVGIKGNVSDETGGIVGIMQAGGANALAELLACYNMGEVFGGTHTGGVLGGAVATSNEAGNARIRVDSCHNEAPVTAKRMAGGVAGYTFVGSGEDEVLLANCYNIGRIRGALRSRAAIAPKGRKKEEKVMRVEECYYTCGSGCGDSRARRLDEMGIGSALAGKGAYQPGSEGLPVLHIPHYEPEEG